MVWTIRSALLMLCGVALGCGSSPAPKPSESPSSNPGTTDEPVSGAAAETTESSSPESAPEPTAAKTLGAQVIAVSKDGSEGSVKIRFDNPTPKPCLFKSYTLTWNGGKKRIEEKPFTIKAQESRQRSLRLHSNDGDLAKLTRESAHIEVETECAQ